MARVTEDYLELRLDRLSSSSTLQLQHLLKTLGFTGIDLDTIEAGGPLRLLNHVVAALKKWMRQNPEHLMDYWEEVLGKAEFGELEKLFRKKPASEDARRKLLHAPSAPREPEGSVTTAEELIALLLSARENHLVVRPSIEHHILHVLAEENLAFVQMTLDLYRGSWVVVIAEKDSAVHKKGMSSPDIAAAVCKAWDFYAGLDPDHFERGVEALFQALTRAVSDHYQLTIPNPEPES